MIFSWLFHHVFSCEFLKLILYITQTILNPHKVQFYTDQKHSISGTEANQHLYTKMTLFLDKCFEKWFQKISQKSFKILPPAAKL